MEQAVDRGRDTGQVLDESGRMGAKRRDKLWQPVPGGPYAIARLGHFWLKISSIPGIFVGSSSLLTAAGLTTIRFFYRAMNRFPISRRAAVRL